MRAPMLLAMSLLVASLAGCAEDVQPAAATEPGVLLVTDENAEDALTNVSFQMQAHLHDYWGGAEKLVVLDGTKEGNTFFISPEWRLMLVPADGSFVPQGASRVEVIVSWTETGVVRYAHPELWVRTASDAEPVLLGAIENGATLTVPTLLENADLPPSPSRAGSSSGASIRTHRRASSSGKAA